MTDNVEPLLFGYFSRHERSVGLEGVHCCHVVAFLGSERRTINLSHAGLDGTAVDDDSRSIVSHGGHETAGHVLVASVMV